MKKRWHFACVLFFSYLFISVPAYAHAALLPEIHLLVDISGSMQKTDPQNLRVAAIKMFNYLLIQKAKMSVSVFANEAKEIIPLQLVTVQFQELFAKKINEIRSDGQQTNIDGALTSANQSWGDGKKIIVILTDGQMDLGSTTLDAKSLKQLNEQTIPRLQQNKVQVYTIGLSEQSDKHLLDSLATKTNALSQTVVSAKDLDSTLYSVFTASVDAEGAPLKKNKDSSRSIKIDPSINEFTLIFKKNAISPNLYLISPKGEKRTLTKNDDGFFSTSNYEVIKINNPARGDWVLSGPEQEMERVLILTDVRLGTDFSSGIYFNNELIHLNGYLEENNQQVTTDLGVNAMEMSLELKSDKNTFKYNIPYDKNGLFSNNLILNLPEATYKAQWVIKSDYLLRERQFIMTMQAFPFLHTLNQMQSLVIELKKPDLIKKDSVNIQVLYKNQPKEFPTRNDGLVWVKDLQSLCLEHSFTEEDVLIEIKAQAVSGRDLKFLVPLKEKLCSTFSKNLTTTTPEATQKTNPTPAPQTELSKTKEQNKKNFTFLIFILLLSAAALITLGLQVVKYRKKINKIRDEL